MTNLFTENLTKVVAKQKEINDYLSPSNHVPFTHSEILNAKIVKLHYTNDLFEVVSVYEESNGGIELHRLTKKGTKDKRTDSFYIWTHMVTEMYLEEDNLIDDIELDEVESKNFEINDKVEVVTNGQKLEGIIVNFLEGEHFNTQVLTKLGSVWVHESELNYASDIEIKFNIPYGNADENDFNMMENFKQKVKSAFNKNIIEDITFTLYKDVYPLEAVIHFTGDEKHYLRYNLYNRDLEIHNTGYTCSNEILEISKSKIIKDSSLNY